MHNDIKKILPIAIAVIVIVAGGSFYGGMKYVQAKKGGFFMAGQLPGGGDFASFSADGRQARSGGIGQAAGGQRMVGAGGGVVSGEILSKDDKSVTLKLGESGTKIIFFSDTTEITKSVAGAIVDLEVGKTAMVGGTANQDGSITAKTIQLRPAMVQPKAQ